MKWQVVFAPSAAEVVRRLPPDLKRSIRAATDALSLDPHLGKTLVRELRGLYSYRVRRYRIVYAINTSRKEVAVVAVGHRADIYEATDRGLRRRG